MDQKKSDKTKITQTLITVIGSVIASIFAGYFLVQSNVRPVQLEIDATQTAEAKLTNYPNLELTTTALYEQFDSTKQAIETNILLTQNANYVTSTAIVGQLLQQATPAPGVSGAQDLISDTIPTYFNFYSMFIIIWGLIAISNKYRRHDVVEQIRLVISKPMISVEDTKTQIILYPRKIFEHSYQAIDNFSISNITRILLEFIKNSIQQSVRKHISNLIKLTLLIFFIWADGIAIMNSLVVMGLIYDVPKIFYPFEIAVVAGSFLSLSIALWTIVGNLDPNSNSQLPRVKYWKKIIVTLSYIVAASSFLAFVGLSMVRFYVMNPLFNSEIYSSLMIFLTVIVIPANNLISTYIILDEAIKGFDAIAIILASVCLAFVYVFGNSLKVVGALLLYILDFQFRLLIIYIYFSSFILFTPLDTLTGFLQKFHK